MKFNHHAVMRSNLLLLAALLMAGTMQAQAPWSSRSGVPAARTSGITEGIPCAGTELFFEDFESGLPPTWAIVDGDTLTPRSETGLFKGWQPIADYDDTTNTVMVSPSWYVNPGSSDDWLITPQISLGANSCLSWTMRSQDGPFPESYEVRISTSNADTTSFLQNAELLSVPAEDGDNTIRSVNLAAYANQDVYLAFRQTSDDKFVLVLDDVKVSNVNNLDIGVLDVAYGTPEKGDTVTFGITVANYGSDTVRSFRVLWSIDNGPGKSMTIDTVKIAPNATVFFTHDSLYYADTLDQFLDLCLWTRLPNNLTDQDISNDTLCVKLPIGSPVGNGDPTLAQAAVNIFPNPFSNTFQVEISGISRRIDAEIRLYDLYGKEVWLTQQSLQGRTQIAVDPGAIAPGIYLLELRSNGQRLVTRRLIRQ